MLPKPDERSVHRSFRRIGSRDGRGIREPARIHCKGCDIPVTLNRKRLRTLSHQCGHEALYALCFVHIVHAKIEKFGLIDRQIYRSVRHILRCADVLPGVRTDSRTRNAKNLDALAFLGLALKLSVTILLQHRCFFQLALDMLAPNRGLEIVISHT